ncbi:MAG: GTPase HflX [Bacteroidales bacterium]|mgnify:FL=1|nr:GTPase HflX [Bacteroidales bacterium]MDD6113899.1 GTPase HflX [Bacteroidales bacterium]MDD7532573.1 GTPase HflX [Bacteroidales bacterium]MDY2857824.1 GTPase HflX [Candidatus Cryptobacteroides sp.]MDY5743880.1 GTPase HflX [Candidatus Cryptobacteroides sp.]
MEIKDYKAVFVGIIKQNDDERKVLEYLEELEFLAETAGAKGDKKFVQKVDKPDGATYIRSGKLEEIAEYCKENDIDYVIFDDELTGIQQRNIEKIVKTAAVIDRTSLILEIFTQRARTSYAKLQVELARYNYMLPRLAGMWTHLERQRGGMGARGGMGEKQIEIDRRIVKERISKLKDQLAKVDKQMAVQRSNRGQLVRLSLVGYTNVGKSTLMNLLAKTDVFAENKLFATLDTTVRKVVIENCPFLLSDTVGFIRKLPTQLVEAFKSTLDEVREADVLLHVVDISHPDFEEQMEVVNRTLKEIDAANKPVLVIFNKIDAYSYEEYDEFSLVPKTQKNYSLDEFKNSWIASENTPCVFISAKDKTGIDKLRNDIYKIVAEIHAGRYPFDNFLW